jgi:ASC-1-like (ASCH) protein
MEYSVLLTEGNAPASYIPGKGWSKLVPPSNYSGETDSNVTVHWGIANSEVKGMLDSIQTLERLSEMHCGVHTHVRVSNRWLTALTHKIKASIVYTRRTNQFKSGDLFLMMTSMLQRLNQLGFGVVFWLTDDPRMKQFNRIGRSSSGLHAYVVDLGFHKLKSESDITSVPFVDVIKRPMNPEREFLYAIMLERIRLFVIDLRREKSNANAIQHMLTSVRNQDTLPGVSHDSLPTAFTGAEPPLPSVGIPEESPLFAPTRKKRQQEGLADEEDRRTSSSGVGIHLSSELIEAELREAKVARCFEQRMDEEQKPLLLSDVGSLEEDLARYFEYDEGGESPEIEYPFSGVPSIDGQEFSAAARWSKRPDRNVPSGLEPFAHLGNGPPT